jgi:hypothetical protein
VFQEQRAGFYRRVINSRRFKRIHCEGNVIRAPIVSSVAGRCYDNESSKAAQTVEALRGRAGRGAGLSLSTGHVPPVAAQQRLAIGKRGTAIFGCMRNGMRAWGLSKGGTKSTVN